MILKRLWTILTLILLGGFFYTSSISANVDNTINFQGKIVVQSDGTNLTVGNPACIISGSSNDTCDFRVRIYNSQAGTEWMFEQTFQDVEIESYNGVFNLIVNGCNSLPIGTSQWGTTPTTCSITGLTTSSITIIQDDSADTDSDPGVNFFRNDLWLEVALAPANTPASLGSFTEVFSRKKLQSAPSAFTAQRLGNISPDGFVQTQPTTSQTISGAGSTTIININETGAGTPDFLNFAVGGGSVFNVRNNGTVGIATSSSTAYFNVAAATAAKPQINLTSSGGVNPTTPTSGDIWWNGTALNFRTGSSTVDLLSGGPSTDLVCTACVSNTEIKTAVGSTGGGVGAGGTVNIAMNDYSFSPNAYLTGTFGPTTSPALGLNTINSFSYIGRFSMREVSNCCGNGFNFVAAWRYITASRDPEIFAFYNTVNEKITNIYRSEVELTNEFPIDISQSNTDMTNLIPVQATIHDLDLYKMDISELMNNYYFVEYYNSREVDKNHPILKQTLDTRDSCLVKKNNDTTKCFRLIEAEGIYYGRLEKKPVVESQLTVKVNSNLNFEAIIPNNDIVEGNILGTSIDNENTNQISSNNAVAKKIINSPALAMSVNQSGLFEMATKSNQQNFIGFTKNIDNSDQKIIINGQERLYVAANSPQIIPGDYITLSGDPGKIEKLIGSGMAVGKAISYTTDGYVDAILFTVIVPADQSQIPLSATTEVVKQLVLPTTFETAIEFKDDITVNGQVYLSNKSTGTVIIPAGEKIGYINFPEPFIGVPNISLTPVGQEFIDNTIFYSVTSKDQNGFKIMVNHPIQSDIRFDWLAIGVK